MENNEAGKRAGDGVARVRVLVCTEHSGMLSDDGERRPRSGEAAGSADP